MPDDGHVVREEEVEVVRDVVEHLRHSEPGPEAPDDDCLTVRCQDACKVCERRHVVSLARGSRSQSQYSSPFG